MNAESVLWHFGGEPNPARFEEVVRLCELYGLQVTPTNASQIHTVYRKNGQGLFAIAVTEKGFCSNYRPIEWWIDFVRARA